MTEEELRAAAWACALGLPVVTDQAGQLGAVNDAAIKAAKEIVKELELGQFAWQAMPCPPGMRSFSGVSKNYNLLVVQANSVEEKGIIHRATAVPTKAVAVTILNLPPDIANYAYHLAAASIN